MLLPNQIEVKENYAIIKTQYNEEIICDLEDVDRLKTERWRVLRMGPHEESHKYAGIQKGGKENRKTILMHRFLMDAPKDLVVDHINGDGLDNRKSNLRLVSQTQNLRNKKMCKNNKCGFKGVYLHQSRHGDVIYSRWVAEIQYKNKKYHLGRFDTPEEAHGAYVEASKRLHKEMGRF